MGEQLVSVPTSILEDLTRDQHARPALDIEELRADIWASEEELDEFLTDWRTSRDLSLS